MSVYMKSIVYVQEENLIRSSLETIGGKNPILSESTWHRLMRWEGGRQTFLECFASSSSARNVYPYLPHPSHPHITHTALSRLSDRRVTDAGGMRGQKHTHKLSPHPQEQHMVFHPFSFPTRTIIQRGQMTQTETNFPSAFIAPHAFISRDAVNTDAKKD